MVTALTQSELNGMQNMIRQHGDKHVGIGPFARRGRVDFSAFLSLFRISVWIENDRQLISVALFFQKSFLLLAEKAPGNPNNSCQK